MSIKILHISDIHIGDCVYDNDVKNLALKIANEIAENKKSISRVDTIVVSGDIFEGSKISKIEERDNLVNDAIDFFETLLSNLEADKILIEKENVIFCPGNHDVIRTTKEADFSVYTNFLRKFYGDSLYMDKYKLYEKYNSANDLISINLFKENKIAILSLNSACVSQDVNTQNQMSNIINKTNFHEFEVIKNNPDLDIKSLKEDLLKSINSKTQNNYLDYGFISDSQLVNMRRLLDSIDDIDSYTIITVFHHHLQLFPEVMLKNKNDISIMKNSSSVIESLLKHRINVVLHGHKHMDLINPITNEQFIKNPNDMIYAISAGSIGKRDITNRMFQIIEIFNKSESNNKLKITKFKYNQDKCEISPIIQIPPKDILETNSKGILKETLEEINSALVIDYENNLKEMDVTSSNDEISKITAFVENTILNFPDVIATLKKDKYLSLFILIVIHYRVNTYKDKTTNSIESIRKFMKKYIDSFEFSTSYYNDLIKFIETDFIKNHQVHKDLTKDVYIKYKNYTSFVLATTLITDMYMFLSKYTDIYFNHIKHKINIKVDINQYSSNIPEDKIGFYSIPDRREISITLKCKNPSFHKVAIIIIKNLEENINRYEKQFANIGLKLYHIKTKVEKYGYEQNDYNFEAYLPTLLKLLIGKNLYKQNEVFVRELIQNSFDAIMLRKRLDPKSNIDDYISIEMRTETESEKFSKQHEVQSKFLSIRDSGIGMNLHNIERYFTGVGRSFYTSHDYEDLKKNKNAKYNAISNFGIGFLSCFMVAEEVDVKTKYFEKNSDTICVNIPNFDGCFFVNKVTTDENIGTTITLYEKTSSTENSMNFEEINNYIKKVFLDFPVDIIVKINNESNTIHKFSEKKRLMDLISYGKDAVIHVFISESGDISYSKENNLLEQCYGIFITFNNLLEIEPYHNSDITILNSGIYLQEAFDSRRTLLLDNSRCSTITYNFPPSLTHLDVSRESIVSFREIENSKENILNKKTIIKEALLEQLKNIFQNYTSHNFTIFQYYKMLKFTLDNLDTKSKIDSFINFLPPIYICFEENELILTCITPTNNIENSIEFKILPDLVKRYFYSIHSIVDYYKNVQKDTIKSKSYSYMKMPRLKGFSNKDKDTEYFHLFIIFEYLFSNSDKRSINEYRHFINKSNYSDSSKFISDFFNYSLNKQTTANNENDFLRLLSSFSLIFTQISYLDIKTKLTINIEKENKNIFKILFKLLKGDKKYLEKKLNQEKSKQISLDL
ncbi:metallophosphoesterase [Clostridium sp. YIM B02506]|uniref:metallophosphoesterase n=1 Tax=Clostridium sp. YIM B02506 TaxID=2910680 RepID=UPI001EEEC1AA|nr:metallophosphoesterase [Clostridium sp. YIM B02506]